MGKQNFDERKIKQIAYFGFADAAPNDPLYQEAYGLSKFLSGKGFVAINGGGPGTMRAVSEGTKAVKGTAIGVTFYPKDITNFEGRDPENPIDIEIKTKNYLERTLKLLELGDAYIVLRGGTGTISEFGMAWGLARLYFGHHKPLILYGEFWHDLMRVIEDHFFIGDTEKSIYKIAKNEDELITALHEFENDLAERCGLPNRQTAAALGV